MDINTTIKDEEALALATVLGVTDYKDGNELILKCAAQAVFRRRQRVLISNIAISKDAAVIDAVATAYTVATGKTIPAPPPGDTVKPG